MDVPYIRVNRNEKFLHLEEKKRYRKTISMEKIVIRNVKKIKYVAFLLSIVFYPYSTSNPMLTS